MQQAFFTGLAGLLTFSRSLDTISNNIANMNTAGFKGNDVFYRSLSTNSGGIGAMIGGQHTRLDAGEIRQTGSSTQLAISGKGFFILKGEHGNFYTRAGNFEFNGDGILVDTNTGFKVQGLNEAGALVDITVTGKESLPPEATTTVSLTGNLSQNETEHSLDSVTVYNTEGDAIKLNIKLTNNTANTPNSWLVEIKDEDGNVLHNGEVRFNADGTPATGFNSLTVNIPGDNNDSISLNFGTPGQTDGATNYSSSSSSIAATVEDGFGLSGLIGVSFNSAGALQMLYSNGETKDGAQIALAYFTNEQGLEQVEGGYFRSTAGNDPKIGVAGTDSFGNIIGSSLEMSNVDLAKEFADMIIVQRGYQASSRAMNIANQLVEQLYESTRG